MLLPFLLLRKRERWAGRPTVVPGLQSPGTVGGRTKGRGGTQGSAVDHTLTKTALSHG